MPAVTPKPSSTTEPHVTSKRNPSKTRLRRRRQHSDAYAAHLQSEYWDGLRRDVVARANGTCELCQQKPLTQVHHLTYEHLGHETLNDVLGLCARCHRYLHRTGYKKLRDRTRQFRQAQRLLELKLGVATRGKDRSLPPVPPNPNWGYRETLLQSFDRPKTG